MHLPVIIQISNQYTSIPDRNNARISNLTLVDFLIKRLKDAEIELKDLKVANPSHAQTSDFFHKKIREKVNSARNSFREGMEHKNLEKRDIKDIIYGLVMQVNS